MRRYDCAARPYTNRGPYTELEDTLTAGPCTEGACKCVAGRARDVRRNWGRVTGKKVVAEGPHTDQAGKCTAEPSTE